MEARGHQVVPQSLFTLLFEGMAVSEPGAQQIGEIKWPAPQGPPSAVAGMRITGCTTMSGLSRGDGDLNSGLHTCTEKAYQVSFLPDT